MNVEIKNHRLESGKLVYDLVRAEPVSFTLDDLINKKNQSIQSIGLLLAKKSKVAKEIDDEISQREANIVELDALIAKAKEFNLESAIEEISYE